MQRILKTAEGQMLFDPDRIESPRPEYFDPQWWQAQDNVAARFKGRGQAIAVRAEFGHAVLKRYFRGGFVRRWSRDHYLFLSARRTRGFHEWHIAQQLWQAELPVAEPIAAWFERTGLHYQAGLLSRQIEHSQTLAECAAHSILTQDRWFRVGQLIARFAAFGLLHPDLNANNILIDQNHKLWVIDFDRARLYSKARSPQFMHQRLMRSLQKLSIQFDAVALEDGVCEN